MGSVLLVATVPRYYERKKSRHGRTPSGIQPCRLTRQRTPRQGRVALYL